MNVDEFLKEGFNRTRAGIAQEQPPYEESWEHILGEVRKKPNRKALKRRWHFALPEWVGEGAAVLVVAAVILSVQVLSKYINNFRSQTNNQITQQAAQPLGVQPSDKMTHPNQPAQEEVQTGEKKIDEQKIKQAAGQYIGIVWQNYFIKTITLQKTFLDRPGKNYAVLCASELWKSENPNYEVFLVDTDTLDVFWAVEELNILNVQNADEAYLRQFGLNDGFGGVSHETKAANQGAVQSIQEDVNGDGKLESISIDTSKDILTVGDMNCVAQFNYPQAKMFVTDAKGLEDLCKAYNSTLPAGRSFDSAIVLVEYDPAKDTPVPSTPKDGIFNLHVYLYGDGKILDAFDLKAIK